jgi:fatty acid desaturase
MTIAPPRPVVHNSSPTNNSHQKAGASLYSELLTKVKSEGLLAKNPGFYIKRFIALSLISLALWGAVVEFSVLHWSWALVIPLAMLLGITAAQFGFIAHEASHRQTFLSNRKNDIFGKITANLFAGLSYGFWMKKHNQHHKTPNQIHKDPDIHIRVLAFRTEDMEAKKLPEKLITKNQGWLFPILLTLTGFDLLLDSFVTILKKDKTGKSLSGRFGEFAMMMTRQAIPVVAFMLLFGPIYGGALWLIFMLTFGLFMGGAFAPNHKGMPLIPEDSKINFFERQVLTSRNIKPSWLKDNLMGGLNYQVEHHLFPSMPRPNLARAREIVIEFCKEKNVPYTEMGLFQSYGNVIKYLNKVGLSSNADPFTCPMVSQFRPVSS